MHIETSINGENTILELALIWILRKFNLKKKKKKKNSTVQYRLKLQNIIYCIVNLKKRH